MGLPVSGNWRIRKVCFVKGVSTPQQKWNAVFFVSDYTILSHLFRLLKAV
jgi:hypothetical protein